MFISFSSIFNLHNNVIFKTTLGVSSCQKVLQRCIKRDQNRVSFTNRISPSQNQTHGKFISIIMDFKGKLISTCDNFFELLFTSTILVL